MISHAKEHEDGPSEEVNALHKEIKCKICREKFPSTSKLKAHLKWSHPGSSVKCELCDRTFFSKRGLAAHTKTHGIATHGIAPNILSDKNDPKTEDGASENDPREEVVEDAVGNQEVIIADGIFDMDTFTIQYLDIDAVNAI